MNLSVTMRHNSPWFYGVMYHRPRGDGHIPSSWSVLSAMLIHEYADCPCLVVLQDGIAKRNCSKSPLFLEDEKVNYNGKAYGRQDGPISLTAPPTKTDHPIRTDNQSFISSPIRRSHGNKIPSEIIGEHNVHRYGARVHDQWRRWRCRGNIFHDGTNDTMISICSNDNVRVESLASAEGHRRAANFG